MHKLTNSSENIQCFGFGNPSTSIFSQTPSYKKEQSDKTSKLNLKSVEWKGYPLNIGADKFIFRPKNDNEKFIKLKIGFLYDYDSYQLYLKNKGQAKLVGKIIEDPNDKRKRKRVKISSGTF